MKRCRATARITGWSGATERSPGFGSPRGATQTIGQGFDHDDVTRRWHKPTAITSSDVQHLESGLPKEGAPGAGWLEFGDLRLRGQRRVDEPRERQLDRRSEMGAPPLSPTAVAPQPTSPQSTSLLMSHCPSTGRAPSGGLGFGGLNATKHNWNLNAGACGWLSSSAAVQRSRSWVCPPGSTCPSPARSYSARLADTN